MVVSAAAGAVGQVVGQIAKIKGCRAVGIAGGPKKCAFLTDELGFDAAIDYKNEDINAGLARTCPDGIDVFFIAPSDLAQTMGHIGNTGHPDVQRAIDGAIAKIVAAGKTPGTLVNDENVASYVEKGVRFVMTSWNAWVAQGAVGFINRTLGAK